MDTFLENTAGDHEIFFSVVSLWEMAIKRALGKLDLDDTLENFPGTLIRDHGFHLLPLEVPHLSRMEKLPLHHQDPFDRLLIAQAMESGSVAVTNDSHWKPYPVKTKW